MTLTSLPHIETSLTSYKACFKADASDTDGGEAQVGDALAKDLTECRQNHFRKICSMGMREQDDVVCYRWLYLM